MTAAYLTKARLEAIVYAIGQTLASASEPDVSREELEGARNWAQAAIDARAAGKKSAGPRGLSGRHHPDPTVAFGREP
jgi:hypothetical protein